MGVLGVAVSGLTSLQQAITTAGNNVVNVNTEGYSRQTVDLVSQPSTNTGAGFVGNGVKTTGVRRVYNEYLVAQVRDYTASSSKLGVESDLNARLDNLLADPSAGLTENLQKLFGALNSVANNPASLPERQVALSEAGALANQVKFLDSSLDSLNTEVNGRMRTVVDEINVLADNIAKINDRISGIGSADPGQLPNDLLDLRDQLLAEISSKVGVDTLEQDDGSINVMVGSGQPLVIGSQATKLTVLASDLDARKFEVGYSTNGTTATKITSLISGGELKGLISFRDNVLNPARSQFGLVLVGLTETFNEQHRLGLDSKGNQGQDFFSAIAPSVTTSSNNAGSAVVSANISDISQVQGADYLMRFDGSDWQVIRSSDNQSNIGSPPFAIDGLDINVSGTAVAGDTFLIQPTANAATDFGLELTQTSQIAAAAALRSENLATNTGDAGVSNLDVTSQTGIPLVTSVSLTFNPDALGAGIPGFDVLGGPVATLAYDPATESVGKTFSFPASGDLSFTVSGSPSTGDQFIIENNTSGVGDNRNMLLLTDLQSAKIMESGQSTYQNVYGNMVASIAVDTRQATVNLKTESSLLEQARTVRDSVSGVNLDEEAANLLRLQQAYQAAAQVISVAQSMFQTLISATR